MNDVVWLIRERFTSPFQIVSSFRVIQRDFDFRERKRLNQARYRSNSVNKAKEKIYAYFYNLERPGYIDRKRERTLRKIERQKAEEEARIKRAELVRKRFERQRLKALKPVRAYKKRVNKPVELRGLNSLDYPHMTLEQRKAWNKWIHETYGERKAEQCRRWRKRNPEIKAATNRRWNQANKHKRRIYRCNPKNRIIRNAYHRIKEFCEGKIESASVLRGCSSPFFYKHIEGQFYGGMTWANYGKVWELDHIKPVCEFNLAITIERLACGNFKNLQPLLIKDNIAKGDRPSVYLKDKWSSAISSSLI